MKLPEYQSAVTAKAASIPVQRTANAMSGATQTPAMTSGSFFTAAHFQRSGPMSRSAP